MCKCKHLVSRYLRFCSFILNILFLLVIFFYCYRIKKTHPSVFIHNRFLVSLLCKIIRYDYYFIKVLWLTKNSCLLIIVVKLVEKCCLLFIKIVYILDQVFNEDISHYQVFKQLSYWYKNLKKNYFCKSDINTHYTPISTLDLTSTKTNFTN